MTTGSKAEWSMIDKLWLLWPGAHRQDMFFMCVPSLSLTQTRMASGVSPGSWTKTDPFLRPHLVKCVQSLWDLCDQLSVYQASLALIMGLMRVSGQS